jgi:hypothetical protein
MADERPAEETITLDDVRSPADFAQALDRVRRASGLSYRRLEVVTGVRFTTIAGWCTGKHLPQQVATKEFVLPLEGCGITDPAAHRKWIDVLGSVRPQAQRGAKMPNPFPGLAPFRTEDADFFSAGGT